MQTIIDALRTILGEPDFYKQMTSSSNYTWDYGAMFEYMFGAIILCIVIAWVFRLLRGLFS